MHLLMKNQVKLSILIYVEQHTVHKLMPFRIRAGTKELFKYVGFNNRYKSLALTYRSISGNTTLDENVNEESTNTQAISGPSTSSRQSRSSYTLP
ncbi:unnamed protein product, partial [Leptidea sinapis]